MKIAIQLQKCCQEKRYVHMKLETKCHNTEKVTTDVTSVLDEPTSTPGIKGHFI